MPENKFTTFERSVGHTNHPYHYAAVWIIQEQIMIGVDAYAHDAQIELSPDKARQFAQYLLEAIEKQAARDE